MASRIVGEGIPILYHKTSIFSLSKEPGYSIIMIRRVLKKISRKLRSSKNIEHQYPVSEEPVQPIETQVDGESEEADPVTDIEVNAEVLERWVKEGRDFQIIDIREPYELQNGFLKDGWNIPMNSIPDELSCFPTDRTLVIVCAAGVRSFQVSHYLRENGLADAWSLDGGVAEWADKGFVFPKNGKFKVGNRVTLAPQVIPNSDSQFTHGRIQNVREHIGEIVYEIGVWSSEGYQLLDSIHEKQLDYHKG